MCNNFRRKPLPRNKTIDRVVGITGGPQKEKVIRAALIGKLVNVLITDHHTAKKLLEDQP